MLRTFFAVGLIAVSMLGWADYRGYGAFDQRGSAARTGSSGSGRIYHK
jgi:hypothetical protein